MKIELHEVRVRELCADYNDLSIQEEGIVGYGGRLNIRPKYQREFVYDEKQRNAVMNGILYLKGGDLSTELQPFRKTGAWCDIATYFPGIEYFEEDKKVVYIEIY